MDKKNKFIRSTQMGGEPARKLFDTLGCANELKAAGFTEKQAEANTKMLLRVIESHLVTSYDIQELETELKSDIKELETKLKSAITELKGDMNKIETSLETKIDGMRKDIKIWFGTLMIAGVTGLGALIGIISFIK